MNRSELFDVSGKVALVTGGSRGIGYCIAHGLVANGATVYVSSRKKDECDNAAETLTKKGPGKCFSIPADCSTEQGCKALVDQIRQREGRLHILVNNAGATWGADLDTYPDSAWNRVLDLNVKGVFHVTKFALDLLRKAATPEDPARVIVTSSVTGHTTSSPVIIAYATSKAAVSHLARNLAIALAKDNITVNSIAPGIFPTKMTKGVLEAAEQEFVESAPLRRLGRPEDIAGLVLFLSSKAGSYVTGAVVPIDGGLNANISSKL
eukprot:TRINITY_DN15489_c0_g1_i1.p1 TRINITY_DN15489_c0_g1~~TRINITY_DN15489_c0_g1_i1.p1  ORF type:complete len:289 (-),score=58.37 TRINITY_DN15489_c0_g1_i1:304-1098(-)